MEVAMREGRLFVISGPSGAGKGTICRELLKDSEAPLTVIVPAFVIAPVPEAYPLDRRITVVNPGHISRLFDHWPLATGH